MEQISFEDVLNGIVEKDPRYHRDAYLFLKEALDHTQKAIAKSNKKHCGHVTAQELLEGIREHALSAFGPMTLTVLEEWGVRTCEDFGKMVFVMVENKLLRASEQDSPEDFKTGYSFHEAFRRPFLPASKASVEPELPQPTEIEKI